VIASTHGPVWRKHPETIVSIYDKWSKQEAEPGVAIVYGSMYGNTTRMMEHVARGLTEQGVADVRIHNVPRSHVSYALRDACAQRTAPLIEVHLTNPAARETFRHTSVVAGVATGTIAGLGLESYRLALVAIATLTTAPGP
jgi:3-dehydroquinate dehydratase